MEISRPSTSLELNTFALCTFESGRSSHWNVRHALSLKVSLTLRGRLRVEAVCQTECTMQTLCRHCSVHTAETHRMGFEPAHCHCTERLSFLRHHAGVMHTPPTRISLRQTRSGQHHFARRSLSILWLREPTHTVFPLPCRVPFELPWSPLSTGVTE